MYSYYFLCYIRPSEHRRCLVCGFFQLFLDAFPAFFMDYLFLLLFAYHTKIYQTTSSMNQQASIQLLDSPYLLQSNNVNPEQEIELNRYEGI